MITSEQGLRARAERPCRYLSRPSVAGAYRRAEGQRRTLTNSTTTRGPATPATVRYSAGAPLSAPGPCVHPAIGTCQAITQDVQYHYMGPEPTFVELGPMHARCGARRECLRASQVACALKRRPEHCVCIQTPKQLPAEIVGAGTHRGEGCRCSRASRPWRSARTPPCRS